MARDPLTAFANEHAGALAPTTNMDRPRQVTLNSDPHSLDPGERALAGLAIAGAGTLLSKGIHYVGGEILMHLSENGSVPYHNAMQISGAPTFRAMGSSTFPPATSKFLGLFPIHSRIRPVDTMKADAKVEDVANKLNEIHSVVDSFINKHHLAEKGVRINLRRGPLTRLWGPNYSPLTKEVTLPILSKEIALHELGHAADYTAGRIGKIRGFTDSILRNGVLAALPVALIAGDRIKELMPGTVDDHVINFMQEHAPVIMGATLAATQLFPEIKASTLAIRHIAQTEGRAEAISAFKKLAPAFGTYLLGAIPAIVGMSLARKYMRQAREEKSKLHGFAHGKVGDLEKTGGMVGDFMREVGHMAKDIGHVGKQIGHQSIELMRHPGTMNRVISASKEVGASPEFVYGALAGALPAALGSLYLYGTHSGTQIRQRIHQKHLHQAMTGDQTRGPVAALANEGWRERHPFRFAGVLAMGAALSGGIMSRVYSDLARVL